MARLELQCIGLIDFVWCLHITISSMQCNNLCVSAQCEVSVSGLQSVEVRAGEEARLSCSTSSADIQFCLFEDPAGQSFIMTKDLPYEGGRLTYHGEDTKRECGIRIANVKESDNGKWT